MTPFPVLMYHSLSRGSGVWRNPRVAAARLADQLELFRSLGYELAGLTEALAFRARDPSRAVVALTFDDGYRDFLDAALPVLDAVGARATLYIPTMYIGSAAYWLGAEARSLPRLLSWPELQECVDAGCVEIGSHSHSHSHLDTLSVDALGAEVVRSKLLLEDGLQVPVSSFCYPHGYHSRAVREAVRGADYDNACEVGRHLRAARHRWSISRLAVEPSHAPSRVARDMASGGPIVLPGAKRALQPAWRTVRRCCSRARWSTP
jgi:peptidoglycan/xylan/chitin deacetylase (PgdA/CDA1 family)